MTIAQINTDRLLSFISQMAKIGATKNGGSNRQALTNEDRIGRDLFLDWCYAIGGVSRLDSIGNLFVRFEGKDPKKLPILMGSHLDTQPSGGKFDGVYGVLAALEVMSTLNDQDKMLYHPVEIVVWCNEEGSRFIPAMAGSGVFTGNLKQSDIYSAIDEEGISYFDALTATKQMGSHPCQAFPFSASLELHIEQGPILEAEQKSIGIVTGVQGMKWHQITLSGETTHAGPTPMSMRKDPIQAFITLLPKMYEKVSEYGDLARITIGKLTTIPSSTNTVPEHVIFSLDLRHPIQKTLEVMTEEVLNLCEEIPAMFSSEIELLWESPAREFDPRCIDVVRTAASDLNLSAMPIVSGAGHDSVYLSSIGPAGMIFVPCKDGISHNEKEHVEPEHLTSGANVLLHSLILLAEEKGE
ncbi:Zn-dependent hydrolase [Psychromonas sp.]|uniref:Zn-dependent hydrolase n=1 Tax=Psychromonas sp. TaxID=1884585 RepID=UPI003A97606F